MSIFGFISRYCTDPDYRFRFNVSKGMYQDMPDEPYLKRQFRAIMKRDLNLENPITLNEKIQWLKLHDRKPIYTTMVDKYAAKQYVGDIIGNQYIIPTLGVWDKVEDIDFNQLPNQFVLKCTHNSHCLVICKDKTKLNIQEAKRILSKGLNYQYFYKFREWAYKDVRPCIIAEKYLEDETGFLTDYKFYCFNGTADCVLTCFDRINGDTKFYFFDREWSLKRYNKMGKEAPEGFTKPKPDGIDKMFELADILAKASTAPFIRVDFYNVYGQIYFGELTLYPAAGYDLGRLPETDKLFGEKVKLPGFSA